MDENKEYSKKTELILKLKDLRFKKQKLEKFQKLPIIIAIILLILLVYVYLNKSLIEENREFLILSIFIYLTIPFLFFFVGKDRICYITEDIKNVSDELDYLNSENQSEEIKSEKKFKMYQNELQKYYSQNLSHSQKIFWVGIISVILGFGIIGYTLWIISNNEKIDNSIQIMITGGIGGILSNFIGVVYLKMYSETLKVLTEFHNKLVYTQNLHFTNCLLAKVDTKELKEEILKESILLIVGKQKLEKNDFTAKSE